MCNLSNMNSIRLIKKGEIKLALESLHKCEALCDQNIRCLAVTYNNFALYYNRTGHPRSAMIYLEKALEMEKDE